VGVDGMASGLYHMNCEEPASEQDRSTSSAAGGGGGKHDERKCVMNESDNSIDLPLN
jgi:hypothetical protein